MNRPLRVMTFEGEPVYQGLLDSYDRTSDSWNLTFSGGFWQSVKHARSLGRRGQGAKIAIIDSGCDTSIPRLAKMVDRLESFTALSADQDKVGHGTAVALLISEIAPDCRLDIYQVCGDGRPEKPAIIEAIRAAAASDVSIINLSVGASRIARAPTMLWADSLSKGNILGAIEDFASTVPPGGLFRQKAIAEEPACDICVAATAAARSGKMLFVAAGNHDGTVSCPAQATGVVATGFLRGLRGVVRREGGGSFGIAFSSPPSQQQAELYDLCFPEIPGVHGTSFAAPLFSGSAALGLTQDELSAYITCAGFSDFAQILHVVCAASGAPTPAHVWDGVLRVYVKALRELPHAHCALQIQSGTLAPRSEPHECHACGIFVESLYVNAGLWLLNGDRLDAAREMLESAMALAPWSADAAANLGRTMQDLGRLSDAITYYSRALTLRPDDPVFSEALRLLREGEA